MVFYEAELSAEANPTGEDFWVSAAHGVTQWQEDRGSAQEKGPEAALYWLVLEEAVGSGR